jgi:AcrR family transcriptional regulator
MGGSRIFVVPKMKTCDDVAAEEARPLRADAQRNRTRVLEAAESVFASEGISVPIDVIAEKAGVGVGTVYRHFPNKEKLFEAILVERFGELIAEARSRIGAADPGAAFYGFLDHVVDASMSKRDLIQALIGAGVEFDEVVGDIKLELEDAMGELLRAAQAAGAVRADVSETLVMSLVGATCMSGDHIKNAAPCEMLAIVCDGLRSSVK